VRSVYLFVLTCTDLLPVERLLAPTERPAMIVRRRLEHAGYDAADGLETLGADEIQFLLRFVFQKRATWRERGSFVCFVNANTADSCFQEKEITLRLIRVCRSHW